MYHVEPLQTLLKEVGSSTVLREGHDLEVLCANKRDLITVTDIKSVDKLLYNLSKRENCKNGER